MTNEEKQEIINAVLSAILTNSKTIEQLTPTESLSDDDAIEVSGGRRISYAAFLSAVQEGVQLMLDGYLTGESAVAWFAALENNPANYVDAPNNPVQLHWRQSPIVLLDSMGEDLDGDDDFTAQVGDKWWDPSNDNSRNYIFLKTSTGQAGWPIGSGNANDVLYVNKRTGRMYLWDGTDMVELVGATGGGGSTVTITRGGGYVDIDIIDNTPRITLSTQSIAMSGNNKTATFKVSGVNLRGPISIGRNNAYFDRSPSSISPVDGAVTDATVTVTFGGTNDDTDDLIVSSPGATSQTVHVTYTAVAGPNIVVSPATLSFKAATNQTQTKQVAVQGTLLTGDVVVTAGGAFQVSLQSGSGFANSVTIPKASALAGITVYVRYTAGSSATTGTLTLTSTGATPKTVDLTGAVSTLTVSPQSLTFSTDQGVAVTQSFTIQGTNLTNGVTLSLTDANSVFSLSKNSLTKAEAEAEAGETITVTYNSSNVGSHSGSISVVWDGGTESVTLSGTAVEVPNFNNENNHRLIIGGIAYGVIDDGNGGWTDKLAVYNKQYSSAEPANAYKYTGEIVIPSTINAQLDGVPTLFTVTTIKTHAFDRSTGMTKLVIPDSVISAEAAFLYMPSGNLKHLVIGNGLTNAEGSANMPTNSNGPIARTYLNYLDLGTGIKRFTGFEIRMAEGSTVVLRSDSVVGASFAALNSNSNNNYAPAIVDGIVKVPKSLVPSYQGASGWGVPTTGNGYYMVEYDNILEIK